VTQGLSGTTTASVSACSTSTGATDMLPNLEALSRVTLCAAREPDRPGPVC